MNRWAAPAAPIQRVLELARATVPVAACKAEEWLIDALAPLEKSAWPQVAWRFSSINGDGFPVEFSFSSADPGLRYTAEVAAPDVAEHGRFAAALRWARWPEVEPGLMHRVAEAQQGALRWGAWAGGCHLGAEGRRKIYVEPGASLRSCSLLTTPPLPDARLRLIGIASGGRSCEYYYRKDRLEIAELGRVLRNLSWQMCFEPLCASVAATLPWPTRQWLVPTDSGLSIAANRALSIYTYARSLWGGDGSIRRHLLDLAARNGWDFRLYEEVTRPLEAAEGCRTHHGILAWITAPGRPVEVRISLRPPG